MVCNVWLHMRKTNQSWKQVLLEDCSGTMKPKGQNAIVLKEGIATSDLESDGTSASLCAFPHFFL